MKKYLFLALLLVLPLQSYAQEVLYSQVENRQTAHDTNFTTAVQELNDFGGTNLPILSGCVTQINFWGSTTLASTTHRANLESTGTGNHFSSSTVMTNSQGQHTVSFNFSPCIDLSSSAGWRISPDHQTGITGTNQVFWYGSNTNTYTDGECSSAGCGSIEDLYFEVIGNADPTSRIVSFTTPQGHVNDGAFGSVNFEYTYNSAEPNLSQACIYIIDVTNSQTRVPDCLSVTASGLGLTYQKNISITEGNVYRYKAVLLGEDDVLVDETQYYFYFTSGTSTDALGNPTATLIPISDEDFADLEVKCNKSGGFFANTFGYGLCVATTYLFVPKPSQITQFSTLNDDLAQKFPFSYIVNVTDTFSALTASSSLNYQTITISTDSIDFASSTPIGSFLPDISISTSTFTQYVSESTWASFRNLLSIVIMVGLITHIFFSARNLIR